MKKNPVQQGRSERKAEAYAVWYVEALSKARTQPGERRVPARRGWAGENCGFCFILMHQDTDPKLFTATPTSVRMTQANPITVR